VLHDFSSVKPGGHVCLPYAEEEEKLVTITGFIRDGLVRGERCVYWGRGSDFAAVLARLDSGEQSFPQLRSKGQVVLVEANLDSGQGHAIDIDVQADNIRSAVEQAHADGFTGLRVIGDPSPSVRAALGSERLAALENKLTELYAAAHATGLCTFDQHATALPAFEVALATHESAIVAGRLCSNPYFTNPRQAEGGNPDRAASLTANILNVAEAQELLEAESAALILESSRVGRRDAAYRAHIAALTRAIEARDRLIITTARWLARPLPTMCSHLADMARDTRYDSLRDVLDTCGDHLSAVTRLSRGLDEISSFLQMQVVLRPEELDIVELTRQAIADLQEDESLSPVQVALDGAESIRGTWDRLRVTHLFHGLIRTARDQGYDTRVRLRLDDLLDFVRARLEFTLPYAPAISDSGERVRLVPYGASDESDYERLAVQLWPARETVRMMGGTLGISTWADARVIFTLDLPKSVPMDPADQG
jgi:hypothetical protein